MKISKLATTNGDMTDEFELRDWQDVELVVLGIANAATVVYLQIRMNGDTAWRNVLTFKATPNLVSELPPGIYMNRFAPHKRLRLLASNLAGGDTPLMNIIY